MHPQNNMNPVQMNNDMKVGIHDGGMRHDNRMLNPDGNMHCQDEEAMRAEMRLPSS